MQKVTRAVFGLLALLCAPGLLAAACEEYTGFTTDELKEMREIINDVEADPLDRRFAFLKMVCADNPNLRHYAIKQGLSNNDDALVRNEIMLMALLEKNRIDVEIGKGKNMTKKDKEFVTSEGGVYSRLVTYRSESEGCLGLHHKNKCDGGSSVIVKGDRVELNYQNVSGVFHLSKAGELVGTLRAYNHQDYTQLPAVIKLY